MPRRWRALVPMTTLSLVLAGCGSASGAGVDQRLAAGMGALQPRVILLYTDVSASVPDTAWHRSLRRLSRELRPGDRLTLFALGGRAPMPRSSTRSYLATSRSASRTGWGCRRG